MKVAIVHDWLVNWGGAENVVAALLKLYPDADIYTLVYNRKKLAGRFPGTRIYTSSLQKIPFAVRLYTKLLRFMPNAFESFDLSGYDLVISSSSSCAKGVIVPPSVPHIAYIHTPMRYAWDLFFDYRRHSSWVTRFFMDRWIPALRQWDYISSQRIDAVIANSRYVARRIKKFWSRDAAVIYPPVNVSFFSAAPSAGDYYVAFSRLVPYKRIDLAVAACGELKKKLVVIGSGSEIKKLRALSTAYPDADIQFTGSVSDEAVRSYLQNCRALIFCAEEDFGIVPVEAQACGRPVIAFGRGGACETVIDGVTGVFFDRQETAAVVDAIERFETLDARGAFKTEDIVRHAARFSEERFFKEFAAAVTQMHRAFSAQTVPDTDGAPLVTT
ncbi:MAG: glycosyltransferase [Treponema sp.]|nr:glycosyltransferase [Treponema sp.]